MSEQRRRPRRRVCYGARIAGDDGSGTDCAVADLSEAGARLRVGGSVTLPEGFDLTIPCRGRTHRARMVWRRADACGVRFVDAAPDSPPPDEAGEAGLRVDLERSREEAAHLRARLAVLETLCRATGTLH